MNFEKIKLGMSGFNEGIRFPGFFDPVIMARFEPVFGPVRLIFLQNSEIRFGWFF